MLSIIIPIYNAEKYLSRCIESILSQSYQDFEILMIDDGSVDDSLGICKKYAEKDDRIRVYHKDNGGVSSARNVGLLHARGEWIFFVDADDELMENALQELMSCISNDVDMVWGGYEVYNEQGECNYRFDEKVSILLSNRDSILNMYVPQYCKYQGFIWNKLYRANIISSRIFFNEKISFNEDRLFITQFLCKSGKSVHFFTKPIYKYYESSTSAMMQLGKEYNPKFISDMYACIMMKDDILKIYNDSEINTYAEREIYYSYRKIVGMQKQFGIKRDIRLWYDMIKNIKFINYLKFEFE